jgi:predicted RNA-binding Zn-ribbon protein involved in translation (DUF1610 family)
VDASGQLQLRDVPTDQEPVFQCPRCHKTAGRQDRFAVHERDIVRVIVRCTECRHRWSVIFRATDPGIEPTPAA